MTQSLNSSLFIGGSASLVAVATLVISLQITQYCRNLMYPYAQKPCIALFAVPALVGWASWVNLFSSSLRLVAFCVNLCKAAGVLVFFQYIEALLGYTPNADGSFYSAARADEVVLAMGHAHCYLRCTRGTPLTTLTDVQQFRRRTALFILQYPAVMVFLSGLVTVVRQASTDTDFAETFTLGATAVQALSTSVALNFLINYAVFTSRIPEVKKFKILHKFILVKVSMLFTEFQPLAISALAWLAEAEEAEQLAAQLNSVLVCCEMILVGCLQYKIFPVTDYMLDLKQTELVSTANLLPSRYS